MSRLLDIKLTKPLTDVKPSKDKNDVLIVPENCATKIANFMQAYGIGYTRIDNPTLYPIEEIDKWLSRYCGPLLYDTPEEIRELIGASAIIAPLDAEDLFQWSLQVIGKDKDPAASCGELDPKRLKDTKRSTMQTRNTTNIPSVRLK